MKVFFKYLFLSLFIGSGLMACKSENKAKPESNNVSNVVTAPDTVNRPANTEQPSGEVHAEDNPFPDVDISPMDMSYFPVKYPQLKMANPKIAPPIMRVIYSRPHLQGRKLFEDILKYGQTWRLGANEATELDVFQTVTIGGKKIVPGRYTLYAIPKAGYWTIAINNDLDLWGLKQDVAQDIVRVQVPVTHYNSPIMEYFAMVFEKTDTGANLIMAWDDVVAKLPIKI